jgi:hypothetical protein
MGNRTRQPAHSSHSLAEPIHEATMSRSANVAGRRIPLSSVNRYNRLKKTVELLAMDGAGAASLAETPSSDSVQQPYTRKLHDRGERGPSRVQPEAKSASENVAYRSVGGCATSASATNRPHVSEQLRPHVTSHPPGA